jgi:hypothetical protein
MQRIHLKKWAKKSALSWRHNARWKASGSEPAPASTGRRILKAARDAVNFGARWFNSPQNPLKHRPRNRYQMLAAEHPEQADERDRRRRRRPHAEHTVEHADEQAERQ